MPRSAAIPVSVSIVFSRIPHLIFRNDSSAGNIKPFCRQTVQKAGRSTKRGSLRMSLAQKTVVKTAAVSDPVSQPVTGQRRHNTEIDVFRRNLRTVCARLRNAVGLLCQICNGRDLTGGHPMPRQAFWNASDLPALPAGIQYLSRRDFFRRGYIQKNPLRPKKTVQLKEASRDFPINPLFFFRRSQPSLPEHFLPKLCVSLQIQCCAGFYPRFPARAVRRPSSDRNQWTHQHRIR